MKNLCEQFKADGYIVFPEIISRVDSGAILKNIENVIKQCALDLKISESRYLKVISRWQNPSKVTDCVPKYIFESVQQRLEAIIQAPLVINRWNIIIKNKFAYGSIPCHQDISYSKANPYFCSTWIPLNTIQDGSGGIKVLPGSHKDSIQPAIDFWRPDFIDHMRRSKVWKERAKSLYLDPGDVVVFHSQLWHGSDPNTLRLDRYSLVIRWELKQSIKYDIPPFPESKFGMMTCGKATEQILREEMSFFVKSSNIVSRSDVLQWWIDNLDNLLLSQLNINKTKARNALIDLDILDKAAKLHNGGDAEGKVYKTLWKLLLIHLNSSKQYA
ncbi:MAG: phytanoyl-CoA dioxygenase family protein [Alphaproteobacteria bacterium]|nr:phytanoyl-CoA dioxygenase family protein [Alphaproteobacteria bacterium]